MPLKHRLARLEAAVASRRRPAEAAVDYDATMRGLRELHADPVQLAMLRNLHGIAYERKLPFERLGDDPEAADIIGRLTACMAAKGVSACA